MFFLIRCLVFLSGTQSQFSSFISFAHMGTILLAHSSLFKFCLNYEERDFSIKWIALENHFLIVVHFTLI